MIWWDMVVWSVGGEWCFELSTLVFYVVARVGAFRGMTQPVSGRVVDRPVPMCCLCVGIPSI